jgi:uncharacterized protein YcbX
VKSCGAIAHTAVDLEARGLAWDRRFMIVDETGRFLTQRERPRLALIRPALAEGSLRLDAPGRPSLRIPLESGRPRPRRVQVWDDVCEAWDEGPQPAAWLGAYLGRPAHLVRMTDDWERPVDPDHAPRPARTGFADAFPLLLVCESSLVELNRRLGAAGKAPVTMDRFRPNVVLDGGEPFAEDGWRTVEVAGLILDLAKPCARCATTTVDQATGEVKDPAEPLATLATFRRQGNEVWFGQNAVHRGPGTLRLGATAEGRL